ncbi:M48 family metallopeptidase [Tenacibaculum sp. UWU-22]|uniref:M48 family metallopeptidase n=1 Tax=Tenacibaculum sp. UWU-22 TaxID=3234187 RepID=UPI0034DB7042
MNFDVDYFDGKSSKTHKATLVPYLENWKISFVDGLEGAKEVVWKVETVQKSEVYTEGFVSFTYGKTFPFQKIESNDQEFINYLSQSKHKNITNKLDNWLHKSRLKSTLLLLTSIVAVVVAMYFYILPTVAVIFVKNLDKEKVENFGNYVFEKMASNMVFVDSQTYDLQHFVDAMQIDCEFPIQIYAVKSNELNAFALSGGKIVVYTSLLEKIENENQLAALIGHEVSHIKNRHMLKNIARRFSGTIFASIFLGNINGVMKTIGENAHLFSQLSYSRRLEKQADIDGLEILEKNHLDLKGMPTLFEALKDQPSIDVPSLFNDHPMLADRIAYTKKIAEAQKQVQQNNILKQKWQNIATSFSVNKNQSLKK